MSLNIQYILNKRVQDYINIVIEKDEVKERT